MEEKRIIIGQMEPRKQKICEEQQKQQNRINKRLQRNGIIFAVVSLCSVSGMWFALNDSETIQAVMSHVTAGFEYDDTLGKLQFVSNILPESAMVFLEGEKIETCMGIVPENAAIRHVWSAEEPWLEYEYNGDLMACMSGEVANVIENREGEYTVRILHENGCESVYSGLKAIKISESEMVLAGDSIGTVRGTAAFEWRKNGLSVQPVFGDAM